MMRLLKNRGNGWILYVAFLMVIGLSGCEFKDIEVQQVDRVEIESFKNGELKGTMFVTIYNPNFFSVKVKSAEFRISSNISSLGTATLSEGFSISGNSTKSYPVHLEGKFGDLLGGGILGILGALSGKDPEVLLEGEVQASSFLISRTIPVKLETTLPISDVLRKS